MDANCPNCGSDNWDFLVNDDAVCKDCGYRWNEYERNPEAFEE